MQDPYKTLGVLKDADATDIKKAFFNLAKEHHPDKGGNPEKFKQINEAYDVLKDPQKRQQYDLGGYGNSSFDRRQGASGFSFSFGNNGFDGFDDVIRDFFHSGPTRSMHRQTMRNKDIKITVQCTLEDIYFQTEKELNVQTPSGQNKNVKLTIPVDADNGTIIRFKGLGDNSYRELDPGNLLVHIKIQPHSTYTRNNFDLFQNYKVSILDILTGCNLQIDHISKTKIKSEIKELSQANQTMRFKGKGMPKRDGTFGDLYIQIKPFTPSTVNKKIIKFIRDNNDA
ncbi:MAG: hypothetical protein CBC05_02795 [Crocinitomicaceae bacterium TMED45]|nr:MAG: hypothetical protein CBC05_02795 [Crocinitomicaceae bacterium TMED45]|tara:strand:+ start:10391 stop:11242 length:852 start_codon:yes stop_codon:yes gene_type:complete